MIYSEWFLLNNLIEEHTMRGSREWFETSFLTFNLDAKTPDLYTVSTDIYCIQDRLAVLISQNIRPFKYK